MTAPGERGTDWRRPVTAEERQRLAAGHPPAGECAACRHLALVRAARGEFVRCRLAATDPSFARYPTLPVAGCGGFERWWPTG